MTITKLGAPTGSEIVNLLCQATHQYQYIRELVQNAKEAGATNVVVSSESINGVNKKTITDNGAGMTEKVMREYLGRPMTTTGTHGMGFNHGCGALITCLHANPAGVRYETFTPGKKNGLQGRLILENSDFGWQHTESGDIYAVEGERRDFIMNDGSGTRITLYGEGPDHDTSKLTGPEIEWSYLNQRYYRHPGINIRIEGRSDNSEYNGTVTGSEHYLKKYSCARGKLVGKKAVYYWYVMKPESKKWRRTKPYRGLVGVIHDNEFHDVARSPSSNSRLRQTFGVTHGCSNVAIIVEPLEPVHPTGTDRLHLKMTNGSSLPWKEWGEEFRAKMPKKIKDMMRSLTLSSTDELSDFNEDLEGMAEVMKLMGLKAGFPAKTRVNTPNKKKNENKTVVPIRTERKPGRSRGTTGIKQPKWVNFNGDGEFSESGLAAYYDKNTAQIFVNSDFWLLDYLHPKAKQMFPDNHERSVTALHKKIFNNALVMAVLIARSRASNEEELMELVSPECLSLVVMSCARYYWDTMSRVLKPLAV